MKTATVDKQYEQIETLFNKYKKSQNKIWTIEQKQLFEEAINILCDLKDLSKTIRTLNNELIDHFGFYVDPLTKIATVTFGSIRIDLKPADNEEEIKEDNVSKAYTRASHRQRPSPNSNKEKELERVTFSYYQEGYRLIRILRSFFPGLSIAGVDMVRNNLLEHPEGKPSGVLDSFVYSKVDGPTVKGLRSGKQTVDMDKGFFNNETELLHDLNELFQKT